MGYIWECLPSYPPAPGELQSWMAAYAPAHTDTNFGQQCSLAPSCVHSPDTTIYLMQLEQHLEVLTTGPSCSLSVLALAN